VNGLNAELDAIQMLNWAGSVPSSKLTKQLPYCFELAIELQ
jgi:hypothetical protein